MHETGLAEGIIEALRRARAERQQPIRMVRLAVGELSGLSPEHLTEHLHEAAEGTEFAHITVETEVRGVTARCVSCGITFEVTDDVEACPECGSQHISVQPDDGVKLIAVE